MSMFTFYFRQSGDARKPFVKAVSEILEAKPRYLGMPSMAYGINFATVTKEGNIELNDRTDSELVENLIERLAERGYEAEPMESPYPADRDNTAAKEESEAPAEEAAPAEMPADDDFGLTISVPRSMFSDTALENLRRLLAVKNELICKALEIDSTAIEVSDETVSFPWWEKDLNPTEVRICSQFIDRLCKFAIASKRVTAKIKTSENERFDMRCWLIRLGCSGPEYKELRAAFMKNLDGDTAFRYGRPEAQRRAEQSMNSEEAQGDAE